MKKTSKLSSDGTNLLTRIPKKIEEKADLKKGGKLEWEVKDGELKVNKLGEKENGKH
jgi:bifunctional DNA-binding transcriptional regulator/antitoxin component of YhaV-PrlF toxin-antitoxin module